LGETEVVDNYRFSPEDLRPEARLPGISAFMRIRNGADFLELTIRSHIDHFDEIVAVYNQCTDATPDILARLAQEYGPKLRVFHYVPRVYPPGSASHAREPAHSPHSLVNYYNFALTRTRCRIATKLDDDHFGMEPTLAEIARSVRRGDLRTSMVCFSGLNLALASDGKAGILESEPFSGNGDIGFFEVGAQTYFVHDRRFERLRRNDLRRRFGGIVYWHLKYLKREFGFANYELDDNPDSRYAARLARLRRDRSVIDIEQLIQRAPPAWLSKFPMPEKLRLAYERWNSLAQNPTPAGGLQAALESIAARAA
jgi:hypothetical protein